MFAPSRTTSPIPAKATENSLYQQMKRIGDALVVKRHPDGSVEAWVAKEARRIVPKLTYSNGEDCTMPGAPGSLLLPGQQGANISFIDMCTGKTISVSPENVTVEQSGKYTLCETANEITTAKVNKADRPKGGPAQSSFEKRALGK